MNSLTKTNNPVIICVLVAVLLGALYEVALSFQKVIKASAAPRAVQTGDASPTVEDDSDAQARPAGPVVRRPGIRDPFARPLEPRPIVTAAPAGDDGIDVHPDVRSVNTAPNNAPLPSFLVRPMPLPNGIAPVTPVGSAGGGISAPAAEVDPTDQWRVSAIFGGARKSAAIEGAGDHAMIVSAGDSLLGYRIVQVTDRDVVLVKGGALRTMSVTDAKESTEGQSTSTGADADPNGMPQEPGKSQATQDSAVEDILNAIKQ